MNINYKRIIPVVIIIVIIGVLIFVSINNSNKNSGSKGFDFSRIENVLFSNKKDDDNKDNKDNKDNDSEEPKPDEGEQPDNNTTDVHVDSDGNISGSTSTDSNTNNEPVANNSSSESTNKPSNSGSSNNTNSNNNNSSSSSNTNSNSSSSESNSSSSSSNQNNNQGTASNNSSSNATVNVKSISLNYTSLTLGVSKTATLTATILPSNATNKTVTWSSSNTKVATVSNGKVKAVSAGTATITAKSNNGKTATCTVKVQNVNKIHYISNGGAFVVPTDGSKGASPANTIVLESNGHFALIDAGLKNSNSLNSGHATLVLKYLKKIGATKLDFILITHDHYDHLGGLSEILDGIQTDVVYIKPYYSHDKDGSGDKTVRTLYAGILTKYFGSNFSCNSSCLENPDSYRAALKKVDSLYGSKRSNVGKLGYSSTLYKINANAEGKVLTLGNATLTMYNTTNLSYHSACYGTSSSEFDENSNSIISYIKMGDKTALLAGDLEAISKNCYNKIYGSCTTSKCSIMNNISKKIKNGSKLNVDLYELSHHGYSSCDMSTSIRDFINPKKIVIPNWSQKIIYYYGTGGPYESSTSCRYKYFNTSYFDSNKYYVGSNNVVFDFTDNGYKVYNNN